MKTIAISFLPVWSPGWGLPLQRHFNQPFKGWRSSSSFELQEAMGTYKLSDFKGKQVVVLAWFPKAFTVAAAECRSRKRRCHPQI